MFETFFEKESSVMMKVVNKSKNSLLNSFYFDFANSTAELLDFQTIIEL